MGSRYNENATDEECTCPKCRSYRPGYPYTPEDPCLRCRELEDLRARQSEEGDE